MNSSQNILAACHLLSISSRRLAVLACSACLGFIEHVLSQTKPFNTTSCQVQFLIPLLCGACIVVTVKGLVNNLLQ